MSNAAGCMDVGFCQSATRRFTAFGQRRAPEVIADVTLVSADVLQDEVTGLRVDLIPLTDELPAMADQNLLPGIPVETYLRADDRRPLSYLAKPLTEYFGKALREG